MADATIPLMKKTKTDFDLNIYSKIVSIFGKISYDEAIAILNLASSRIIPILEDIKNKQ